MANNRHNTKSLSERRNPAYIRSALVALSLAVLTIAEYIVAVSFNSLIILLLLAVLKAALVVWFFMHVSRLWTVEEH